MNDLEKSVIGKWVDLRESSRHLFSIMEYWKPGKDECTSTIAEINSASEQGIVEFKLTRLQKFFRTIRDVKHRSFSIESIFSHMRELVGLSCVSLIQRLIALGVISLSHLGNAEDAITAETIEVPLILRDVLARIKENSDLRNNGAVKNILVQFAVYTREKETLEKLKTTVKDVKAAAFYANFKETFDRIFSSIRKSYEIILREEASRFTRKRVLTLVPLVRCAPVLNNQARLFSRISSTIDFVHTDKYKVREALVGLLDAEGEYTGSVNAEMKLYTSWGKSIDKLDPEKAGVGVTKAFNEEIVTVLERHLQKEFPAHEGQP